MQALVDPLVDRLLDDIENAFRGELLKLFHVHATGECLAGLVHQPCTVTDRGQHDDACTFGQKPELLP